jgi:hypothetical protein
VPKLLLNDNDAGKPEGMQLMIGRRPHASFGNSTGDQQMLEYTKAGDGARLSVLMLHDDAKCEYAYGGAGLDHRQQEARLEADHRVRVAEAALNSTTFHNRTTTGAMLMKRRYLLVATTLMFRLVPGSASAQDKAAKRAEVLKAIAAALDKFYAKQPNLKANVANAPGYAVFIT